MTAFEVRPAQPEDARGLAELFAAVAEERDRIATEPPVDVEARTKKFVAAIDGTILAVASGDLVGSLHIFGNKFGVGEFGMAVARPWRGRGVGSALLATAIEKARGKGCISFRWRSSPTTTRRSLSTANSASSRRAAA